MASSATLCVLSSATGHVTPEGVNQMRRLPAYARWAVAIVALVVVALCAGAVRAAPPPANVYVDAAGLCKGKVPCYTTIQAGIDAAVPGNVVQIYRGTYHEHVLLATAITLRGDGNPVVTGDGSGDVITVTAVGATLTKLTVQNGAVGVRMLGDWVGAASGNMLLDLKISGCESGILFSGWAHGNTVQDTDVTGSSLFAINVGDSGNSGNQFLHLKLHKNPGKGLNAYSGSDGLVLRDSSIEKNGNGGVQIGWSGGWTIEHNEIVDNVGMGVLTDTVWSGAITHNYIARNSQAGVGEAGYVSTVTTRDNRIESNAWSGVYFQIGSSNVVQHNMLVGNGRYGVEIPYHSYGNNYNSVTGNYIFKAAGSLGDAFDDAGLNTWDGNYYSGNLPWVAPFLIPGLAATTDTTPLMQSALPKPATKADCRKDGWWLLTNGTAPFANEGKCVAFAR